MDKIQKKPSNQTTQATRRESQTGMAGLMDLTEAIKGLTEQMSKQGQDLKELREFNEKMDNKFEIMCTEIKNTKIALQNTQKVVKKNEKDIIKIKKRSEVQEAQMDEHQSKLEYLEQDNYKLKTTVMRLEIDRAQLIMRIQNYPEEQGENVKERIIDWLIEVTQMDKELIQGGVDTVHRQSTRYARINKLPREIVIKFTQRIIREMVQKSLEGKELTMEGKNLKILKDVPWSVRQRRKQYKDLAMALSRKNIRFKWLIPEGMFFNYKGQKCNIDSEIKLHEFTSVYGKELNVFYSTPTQEQQEEFPQPRRRGSEKEEEEAEGMDKKGRGSPKGAAGGVTEPPIEEELSEESEMESQEETSPEKEEPKQPKQQRHLLRERKERKKTTTTGWQM